MNTILVLLALVTLVVAQEAYAPAEYMGREERQAPAESEGNWLTRLISGNWWNWDRDAVKTGIFLNENIMISIGQGLFNFVFSTLAWFTVSQIYSLTAGVNTPRNMRALTISEAAEQVLEAFEKFEERN